MEEKTYTILELFEIKRVLEQLLILKGTGLTFLITKNIYELNIIGEKYKSNIKTLKKKFTIQNSEGKPKRFLLNEKNELVYENEKPVETVNDSLRSTTLIDQSNEYLEALEKFNEEPHKICFVCINEKNIQELCEKNIIEGIDLSPLYGNVIIK